ncbi:hypothetical protein THII_1558 [Thioploca ingrica]|uniref:Secreted protein n=1 Tax=Thioploca ingrica TaxID=40754 RepID=A0A090ALA8_9GAMM|nr:hypothetical protein THII_1558 [Thioploca ingrica]
MLFKKLVGLEKTLFIGLLATSLGGAVLPVTGFGASTDQQSFTPAPNPNGADVWIRDGIADTGAEPSPPGICGGWWCSEDIVNTTQ